MDNGLDVTALFAEGLKKFANDQLASCFNVERPDLKATPIQESVLRDTETLTTYIVGGNRCNSAESLILMADGTQKRIVDIRIGDKVMSLNFKTHKLEKSYVTELHRNGIKPVNRYYTNAWNYLECTDNHRVVISGNGIFYKSELKNKTTSHLTWGAFSPLEGKPSKYDRNVLEIFGYLIGDGSFSQFIHRSGFIRFTNTNPEIVKYVNQLCKQIGYRLRKITKGDYAVSCQRSGTRAPTKLQDIIRDYDFGGRKALNKYIPDILFTETLDIKRKFIGGLIATDGWISGNRIGYSTTSKQLAIDLQRLFLTVGLKANIKMRSRNNPNHNNEYTVQIAKASDYNEFLDTIVVPGKSGKKTEQKRNKMNRMKIRKIEFMGEMETYDITVSHPDSNYICNNFVISNSGKSQLGSRVTSWWFTETHPYMSRPKEWGNGPLTIMVIGRVGEQIESELFHNKLKPYLEEDTYKIVRIGNVLQRLEHKNGNRMLFFSHHNINEAREKVQAFTTHFIWLDEMADSASFIAELQTRLLTTRGRMLATFTPLIRSDEVRQLVDNERHPISRKVKLSMLDNPLISNNPERVAEIMEQYDNYSESERNTRLYGDWYYGDTSVYEFQPSKNVAYPRDYSYNWKHIVSVDPAMAGKTGLTVWAECPRTGVWYSVVAEYLENILTPEELVDKVESRIKPFNIIRRVSDPHEVWYINTAAKHGKHYVGVYKKNERKKELIKNFQTVLSNGNVKIHPECRLLIEEIISCQWSETVVDKIVNATKYHLLDSSQYFVDNKPKWIPSDPKDAVANFESNIRKQHKEAKKLREKKLKIKRNKRWR